MKDKNLIQLVKRALEKDPMLNAYVESLEQRIVELENEKKAISKTLLQHRRDLLMDYRTNLWNQYAFDMVMPMMLREANKKGKFLSLIFFDIDNFGAFNKEYGQQAGNYVLREAARRIKGKVRTKQRIDSVYRLGGEEIGILLPGAEISDAYKIATERLRFVRDEPYRIKKDNKIYYVTITMSGGVVDNRTPGVRDAKTFYESADRAMAYAKTQGKNQVKMASEIPEDFVYKRK